MHTTPRFVDRDSRRSRNETLDWRHRLGDRNGLVCCHLVAGRKDAEQPSSTVSHREPTHTALLRLGTRLSNRLARSDYERLIDNHI